MGNLFESIYIFKYKNWGIQKNIGNISTAHMASIKYLLFLLYWPMLFRCGFLVHMFSQKDC